MKRIFKILFIVQLCLFGELSEATEKNNIPQSKRYNDCMSQSRMYPGKGIETAKKWLAEGEHMAAKHCLATGKFFAGFYETAAIIFENLTADKNELSNEVRAQLFSQAGHARLLMGQPEKALENQTSSIDLYREDPQFFLDRAITQMALRNYEVAIADIDRAIQNDPSFGDALLFRAIAKRSSKDFDGALIDVNNALAFAPNLPAALLERGIILNLVGQLDSAVLDWLKVIDVAPNSSEAISAGKWIDKFALK